MRRFSSSGLGPLVWAIVALLSGCAGDVPSSPGPSPDGGHPPDAPVVVAPDSGAGAPDATVGASPDGGFIRLPDAATTGGPAGVRFIGRWDRSDASAPRANWSGSAVEATFSGTQVSVILDITSVADPYVSVIIDGASRGRIKGQTGRSTTALASDLASGNHTVRLALETEAQYGFTRFIAFDFGGGHVLAPPLAAPRRLEIVGDSISCGYGNDGTSTVEDQSNNWSAPTCPFSTATESSALAYGTVLAGMLDAEVTTICFSGKGVYEDLSGATDSMSNPQMVTLYQDALLGDGYNGIELHQIRYPSTAAPATAMDVVLVNLGTNDISGATHLNGGQGALPPKEPFKTAYLALIGEIRAVSPDAVIFVTLGPLTGEPLLSQFRALLDEVIGASGDDKIHRVDLDVQDSSLGVGCDWHPTSAEDERMAAQLRDQMRPVLGL